MLSHYPDAHIMLGYHCPIYWQQGHRRPLVFHSFTLDCYQGHDRKDVTQVLYP